MQYNECNIVQLFNKACFDGFLGLFETRVRIGFPQTCPT